MRSVTVMFMYLCIAGVAFGNKINNNTTNFVFLKFKEEHAKTPGFRNTITFRRNYPNVYNTLNKHASVSVYCPFHVQDKRAQSIYYVKFEKNVEFEKVLHDLKTDARIEYIEKAPSYNFSGVPDDYNESNQWFLKKVMADSAWINNMGTRDVKIAVADAAFNTFHEDLEANLWQNLEEIPGNGIDDDLNGFIDDYAGWDAGDNDNDPGIPTGVNIDPVFSHGNFVAGIAAGVSNNGKGICSVSNNVSFIPIKVSSGTTNISIPVGAAPIAVDYAIASGADIMNMSFGSFMETDMGQTMHNLVQIAVDSGLILVAAAGNAYSNDIHYPAKYPEVIAVGATDENDYKWAYSNYSSDIAIMAPGVSMYSSIADAPWYEGGWDGTSFASPLVCSSLALMKSMYPEMNNNQITGCLFSSAEDITNKNMAYSGQLGSGRLNVHYAINCLDSISKPIAGVHKLKDTPYRIFPNPSNGSVSIEGQNIQRIELYSAIGKLQYQFNMKNDFNNHEISDLSPGIYFVQINNGKQTYSTKLIVK